MQQLCLAVAGSFMQPQDQLLHVRPCMIIYDHDGSWGKENDKAVRRTACVQFSVCAHILAKHMHVQPAHVHSVAVYTIYSSQFDALINCLRKLASSLKP